MAERIVAVILIVLFAWFLYISLSDILQVTEARRFGDLPLLIFCAVVCAGWIVFLAGLCWPARSGRSRLFHLVQR
jgi:hypothetical protein